MGGSPLRRPADAMKKAVLTPAENLRLQARYLPELVSRFASAPKAAPPQEADEICPPRKRVVLCEDPAALLREGKLFLLSPSSPLWQELEALGPVPLYVQFRPGPARLEQTCEGAVLSGDGCWLKSQFPVVLLPGPVPRQSPLLAEAAAVYALRPLSSLERRHLQRAAVRVVETGAGNLPGFLENHHCRYVPGLLSRPARQMSWSEESLAHWNTTAVLKDFNREFARLSQPRSLKLWTSDLLHLAQEQLAEVFFDNLRPELSGRAEPLELSFTRSYLAVSLYARKAGSFVQAVTGKAGACVQRMNAAKEQIERQAAFTDYLNQIGLEIKKHISQLQAEIWEEWRKLEWWE